MKKSSPTLQWFRQRMRVPCTLVMLTTFSLWSLQGYADVLYKSNAGNSLDTAYTVGLNTITNYAEGAAFAAGDSIAFTNLINAARTFRVSSTNGVNLAVNGLILQNNLGGAVTIQNSDNQSQTITLGAGGIDMLVAPANLTLSSATGGTMTLATSAAQTWSVGNGRTLTVGVTTLANNVTINGNGTTTFAGAITGAGNLIVNGGPMGGNTVNLSANNSGWTGSLTVGGNSIVNIENFATAGQNRINPLSTLTLNRGRIDLTNNASNQTQGVAALSLGQGLNVIQRTSTSTSAKLDINGAITRTAAGAALNVTGLGTLAAPTTAANSPLVVDTLNTNGILGAWAVNINGTTDINWISNGGSVTGLANSGVVLYNTYTTNNAPDTWTTATQNILMNATGTAASTASRTINSLKIAHTGATTAVALDIGAGNTLTLNDGQNGGGIMRNQNADTDIGNAAVGVGFLTAGGANDSVNDTLYLYNSQATMRINSVIRDNNTGVGTDALHLFVGGAGTVTVMADNTYTGGTTIAAGILAIGNNNSVANNADLGTGDIANFGTLVLSKTTGATAAQMTLGNNISGTGAFTINRGVATLTGNNTYQGNTNVSATTTLKAGSAGAISPHSRMLLNAGTAILDLNGFNASTAALRGDVTTAGVLLGGNTLTLTGSDLSSDTGTAGLLLSLSTQAYQGAISGAGNVVKNGGYTQTFTAGGTLGYTGTTTVNGGILQTNKAMATSGLIIDNSVATLLGANATFISNVANALTSATTVNLANSGATWQINTGFNQTSGAVTGAANSRILVGRGATDTNLTVTDNGGVPSTFAGVIAETGTGASGASVTKEGTNTWVLTGGNGYTGATTINGGTIQVGTANPVQVIPDRSAVVLGNVAGATLDLNGNNETIGSLAGGGATGGTVSLGAGRLTVGLDNSSTSYGGVFTGTGGLVKVGDGTLTLTGSSAHFGAIQIVAGGLTLAATGGGTLAATTNVNLVGRGATLNVNSNQTLGVLTGGQNSVITIGTGATLSSGVANVTATTPVATLVSGSNTATFASAHGLTEGMQVTGTSVVAGTYVRRVINATTVELSQPANGAGGAALTGTASNIISSSISGAGGYTKEGTGLVWLTTPSTYTGATTVNAGTLLLGSERSPNQILSSSSALVVNTGGTVNFFGPNLNMLSYQEVGSLAGTGGTINLFTNGVSRTALVAGGDDSTTAWAGTLTGDNGDTAFMKTGSGVLTLTGVHTYDGVLRVERGGVTVSGTGRIDNSGYIILNNAAGAIVNYSIGANTDDIAYIGGGGRVAGFAPFSIAGAPSSSNMGGNILGGTGGEINIAATSVLRQTANTSPRVFGGILTGAGTFQKAGTGILDLWGANTISNIIVENGTLRTAAFGEATGLGALTASGFGSFASGTSLRLTGGTLDLAGSFQTVTGFTASSSGGTVALYNGGLTLQNQTTQSVATVFTGTVNSVLNVNGSGNLSLTNNNTGFGGTINVGSGMTLTSNRASGAINSTGTNFARVNLAAGSTYVVTLADTIGSLSGAGNVTLTQNLTLSRGYGGSSSAAAYSGTMSGGGALILSAGSGFRVTSNQTYTGGTTLNAGSVLIADYNSGANNILPNTGVLTLAGGTLRIASSAATVNVLDSTTSTTLNAGASAIETWKNLAAEGATVQTNGLTAVNLGLVTRNAGGTLNIATNAAALTNANASGIVGGWAIVDGSSWAVSNGATASVTALPTGSYVNTFAVGSNTDVIASGAGAATNSVRFNTAGAFDVSGTMAVTTGGLLVTASVGANTSTISAALSSGASNELIIHQYNPLGNLVLSNVAGSNTVITTAGGGKTVITNNVAGTGATNVGYGYLQLGDGGAAGMVGSGAILNNGAIGINRNNAQAIAAVISGTGNLEQVGSGTTTLSGASTYTGRTTVRAGTLVVTHNTALGSVLGSTVVSNGAQLDIGNGTDLAGSATLAEIISLKGGTLRDNTTIAAQTVLSQNINLLGANNTISVVTAADELRITGAILGLEDTDLVTAGLQSANVVIGGSGRTTFEGNNWYYGTTTINSGATLALGRNNAAGNLGLGSVINNGQLFFDRSDTHYFGNAVSGSGDITVNRSTVFLAGDLSGATGALNILGTNASVQVYLGDHDYLPGNAPGFSRINVTSNASGSSGVRFNQSNNILTMGATLVLQPTADTAGLNSRLTYFIKNGLSTLNLTGKIAGENAATSTDDRSYIEVNHGLLRIVTDAASNNYMMGLTGGNPDTTKAFGGQIALGGDANVGRVLANWGYFEITGDANQTISANITGGGNSDQGGIFIYNSTGTLTLNPTTVTIAATGTTTITGNNLFNSRNQINRGTVILQGGVAWRDDGFLSVASGAKLQIGAAETTNVGIMKGGTLQLDAAYTNNGNLGLFAAGQITGVGAMNLNGNVTNRFYHSNNTFAGGLTLNRGILHFASAGSLGSGTITLASGASAEAENQLLQHMGLDTTGPVVINNAINVTGSALGRLKGVGAYGVSQLNLAGTITINSSNRFYIRGSSTGQSTLQAPYGTWTAGMPTVSGRITGAGDLVKEDAGAWSVTNTTNDFTGNIFLNNGRFSIPAISVLGNASKTINLGSGTGTPQWEFDSTFTGGTLAATTNIDLTGTTGTVRIVNLGSGALTIADATWAATGGGAKTLALGRFDDVAGYTNVISGIIVNNSGTNTTALTKDGQSTWRLTGVNSFTGAVTVNNGTLQLANASGTTLADSVDVTLNNSFGRGSILELLTSETIDHLAGNIGAEVKLNANTLTIGSNNGSATYNGLISGSGGIIKTGTAAIGFGGQSQTLPNLGQNTYTGVTRINGGRIDTATLANGGVMSGIGQSSNAASNLVLAGTVADSGLRFIGTHNQSTDRSLTLGPAGSLSSPTAIWADGAFVAGIQTSSISFNGTANIGFTGTGARTLTLRGSNITNNVFNLGIIDNGAEVTSLVKTEDSVWVLGGTNSYTGTTTINRGTLAITTNSALGSATGGTTVQLSTNDTRAFLDLRGVTVTGESLTLASGANGNTQGFGASTGTNIWTGNIAVNANSQVPVFTGATLTLSTGTISGSSELTKLGEGTLVLAGVSTATGAFNARGGIVELDYTTNATSKLADGAALRLGASAGGVAVQGMGLYNGGSNALHTAGTIINLKGDAGGGVEIVSATSLDAGSSYVTRSSGSTILRLNDITRGIGGTLDVAGSGMVQVDDLNTNNIIGGWMTFGKTDWAVNSTNLADGAVAGLAAINYTANTFAAANNVDITTSTSQSGAAHTVRFNTAGALTLTLSAATTLNTGGILVTANVGNNATTITGSTLTGGNTADSDYDLIVHQYNSGPLVIESTRINNGGNASGLTISGTGPVVVLGDNTNSGQTTINTGATLRVGNAGGAYGLAANGAGTLGGNATIATTYTGNITNNGSLIFDGSGSEVTISSAINGNGTIELAATNTRTIIINNVNNYYGDTFINGGTLAYGQGAVNVANNSGLNAPGLGSNIGRTIIGSGGRLEFRTLPSTNPQTTNGAPQVAEFIVMTQGSELAIPGSVSNGIYVTTANANLSHRLDLNNTTAAGATISVVGNNHLSISGVIKGSNGFTKDGNGILQITSSNWVDGVPTLSGQVIVNGGILYATNARSLGATGVGNETIVNSGGTLDLRDADMNFGDDATATREIIQISGIGHNGTGALRNTAGTGTIPILQLIGNARVAGSSRIDITAYDTNINPGITATYGVLNGGGFELTKTGINEFVLMEATINNLGKLIVSEGEFRAETRAQFPYATNVGNAYPLGNPDGTPLALANYPHTIFSSSNITNGIDLVYGGQTPDPVNTLLMNSIVGARLDLYRQHGAHHTANIASFGRSAGSGGNLDTASYLELSSDTLSKTYTFWDGNINLTGLADGSNTLFNIEGGGAGTNINNAVLGAQSPAGDQVVSPQSMLIVQGQITGTGGFTKIGSRELRLTGNNTFTGDTVLTRSTGTAQPVDPTQGSEARVDFWGTTLYGQGTLANTANLVLERRGILRVDNTSDLDGTNVNGAGTTNVGANLTNRINDNAVVKLRDGYLVFDSGNTAVTETLGVVRAETGNNFIVVDPKNGANVNTTITLTEVRRQAGADLVLSSWDSTSVFGTTAPAGTDSVRFALTSTAGLTLTGAGSGTARQVAVGVYSGMAPVVNDDPTLWSSATAAAQSRNNMYFSGRHFTTLDGGYLRPLDDSEYYTDTSNMTGAAGQNLNLSLPSTSILSNLAVNSLRFGNLDDTLGNNAPGSTVAGSTMLNWQQTTNALTLDDSATLSITSGMILFANMGQGMVQDMNSYINGGTIDFGGNEGILSNINGYYRTQDGSYQGSAAYIRSAITGTVAPGSVGLTKTGFQEIYLQGRNTYTGYTQLANGALRVTHNMGLGAGGTGNGVVIEGAGQLYLGGGINVGAVIGNANLNNAGEDIYVGRLSIDNQYVLRSVDSVNRYFGNLTLDLIDTAGQTGNAFLDPRIGVDANATLILAGNIGGGNTAVTQDTYYVNPRQWTMDGSGNGYFILQGSVGDKLDAFGNALSVSGPVTNKPTGTVVNAVSTSAVTNSSTITVANTLGLWANMPITGAGIPAGTTIVSINALTNTLTLSQNVTIGNGDTISTPSLVNENEVLVSWLGGNDELMVEAQQQWMAVGRIELMRGSLRYTGTGDFYDANTLALINGSEAGNAFVGLQIGSSQYQNTAGDGAMVNFMLTKAGQSLGLNNWTITTNASNNQGAIMIGGENETGTVRYGPASVNTQSTIALGRNVGVYASAGGTVDFYSRFTGGSVTKLGRGTVNLFGSSAGDTTTGTWQIAGGELVMDYSQINNRRNADAGTTILNGGTIRFVTNATTNTTQAISNANDNEFRFRPGGTEIIAQAAAGRTMTLNIGRLSTATDGAVLVRSAGSTANFVEFNNGGTSVITFAAKTGLVTNALLPYATYGDAPRRALDFAMVDTNGNNVNAFGRAQDEFNNDVATWALSQDVSENGGSGFRNNLASNLTINSVRFDSNTDSVVNLGANTLTVGSGGLLVSSNVGTSNKTITGGVLTSVGVQSGTTTNATNSITGIASTANLYPGMPVSGAGIPAGAYITAITGASSVTISANATAGATVSLSFGSTEMLIHHYSNGTLTIGSQIGAASGAAPASVSIAGPSVTGASTLNAWSTATTGQVVLTADNSVAGVETKWMLNGSILSISNENQLGKVALAATTADSIYMNGGALRWTAAGNYALDANRGITIGGNGGVIDVVDGSANLQLSNDLTSESWLSLVQTGATNAFVGGDLIKMGAGTLTFTGGTDSNQGNFTGGIDVREGTLRVTGNNTATSGTQTVTIFGTNRSELDGTTFRPGTNLELAFGPAGGAVEWETQEWLRFEGNNTIRFGIPGATNRVTRLAGVIDLAGNVNVDVVAGMTARFNQSSGGYLTGTGNITKIGQGTLELRDNNVLWSGALNIYEGQLRLSSTGLPAGVGTQAITLGSTSHQGIAELQFYTEQQMPNMDYEVFQNINVIYNPLQTKRLVNYADVAAGTNVYIHGDITMSDNLGVYGIIGSTPGGSFRSIYLNGKIVDDVVNNRSGNLTFLADHDTAANNAQAGAGAGYFYLRGDNSGWSGDVTIGTGTSWDQDEITVLRVENSLSLGTKNDVTMNGSSKLQVAGNTITIGSLITNNGSTASDGSGNFQGTTGSSAWIENGSTTAGKLVVTQTTPSNNEALWDVKFQDGRPVSSLVNNNMQVGAALSVEKKGNGWATMSVDNDHTGSTILTEGILQVGRNGIGDTGASNAAGFTSAAGTRLAGTGFVQGASTILGDIRPGDEAGGSMGTLTFTSSVSLGATSTATLQAQRSTYTAMNQVSFSDSSNYSTWLSGLVTDTTYSHMLSDPLATTQHDRITVNGTLNIVTGSTITLVNNGYTPTAGDVFNLFDWSAVSGAYNVGGTVFNGGLIRTGAEVGTDLNLFELGGNFRWDVSLFNSHGVLVVVVPEPSRMLLLVLGLFGLFFRRRRHSTLS